MAVSEHEFSSFGELLRHLRRKARLTQRELGIAVGYSEAHIARLEANQRRPDVAAVTARFLEALSLENDVETAQLLVALAASRKKSSTQGAVDSELLSDAPPTNLREQLTAFIGREDEMAEAKRLLRQTRLLTITGAGGIGKSRLAAQLAAEMLPIFGDGAWIASFVQIHDPEQVLVVVAGTMNLASADLLDGLKNYLRNRKALLVLDNCEHLITACARLALTLLQACPELIVIATSRESLGIPGETAWEMPPMTCEQTHQLFVERARSMKPDFEVTPENEPMLAQICDELEGIPLCVELAATRLQVLSLQEIVDLLDDRFKLLSGGSRLAHPRHQSLRALIDWSVALLSVDERKLFHALAQLEPGFTRDDAERVAVASKLDQDAVLDLLAALVRKSLLLTEENESPTRYSMLKSVRLYAAGSIS
jgi:predicted ATPase/DNA-binding XRE family transcriptional regulator